MDLFCPHCTRRVSIPDDKAGQVLSCPLCAKQFQAPSLAPAAPPTPKPPPTPAPPPVTPKLEQPVTYGVGAPPPSPKPTVSAPPTSQPAAPPSPPSPPPPPGDYTKTWTFYLRGTFLSFVPLLCLVLIFVLSFFTWHVEPHTMSPQEAKKAAEELEKKLPSPYAPYNMWSLGWGKPDKAEFLAYSLLLIFILIFLAIPSLLAEKEVFPIPPGLKPLIMWKDLIIALFLIIGYLVYVTDYIAAYLSPYPSPIKFPMEMAVRLHLLAIIASLLLFWSHWRKMSNSPPPKVEIKW